MMNEVLYPLIGNKNALSLTDLVGMNISEEELRKYIGEELAEWVSNPQTRTVFRAGTRAPKTMACTDVYVWGDESSGKTSVIGSLLSAVPDADIHMNSMSTIQRIQQMRSVYASSDSYVRIPTDMEEFSHSDILLTVREPGLFGQKHCFALKENSKSITKNHENIHLFCIDCTDAECMGKHVKYCQDKLTFLKNKGFLENTSGIFVLVTKFDALSAVPEKYRYGTAQTMITSGYPTFWQEVKNCGYSMHIYDAKPIPFSIGNVKLRELAKMDNKDARELMEYRLMVKSSAQEMWVMRKFRSLFELMGTKHSKSIACLLSFFALMGIVGVMSLFDNSPVGSIRTYDYIVDVNARIDNKMPNDLNEGTGDVFLGLYRELYNEGNIGRICRNDNGEVVYDSDSIDVVKKKLLKIYIELLAKDAKLFLANGQWDMVCTPKTEWYNNFVKLNRLDNPPIAHEVKRVLRSDKDLESFKMMASCLEKYKQLTQYNRTHIPQCKSQTDVELEIKKFENNFKNCVYFGYSLKSSSLYKNVREELRSKAEKSLEDYEASHDFWDDWF